jgi:hypothetical protein
MHPPPPPQQGSQAGQAGRVPHSLPPLPSSRPLPGLAPSWASIVQGGAHTAAPPAVSRQEFLALYERCIASGLRSRIVFRHQAGSHQVSIPCCLSAPPTDTYASAIERCRRRGANMLPPPQLLAPHCCHLSQHCLPLRTTPLSSSYCLSASQADPKSR